MVENEVPWGMSYCNVGESSCKTFETDEQLHSSVHEYENKARCQDSVIDCGVTSSGCSTNVTVNKCEEVSSEPWKGVKL